MEENRSGNCCLSFNSVIMFALSATTSVTCHAQLRKADILNYTMVQRIQVCLPAYVYVIYLSFSSIRLRL